MEMSGNPLLGDLLPQLGNPRRWIEREAKAKVVASVWGADFVQFLAALAVLPWSTWKDRMSSTVSDKMRLNGYIEQYLPPKQTQRSLPLLLYPSFFYVGNRGAVFCS